MTFTSIGNAKASIMVAVMRKFILLVPLIYILPHLVSNPTMGVYLAEPVADVLAVAFTLCSSPVSLAKRCVNWSQAKNLSLNRFKRRTIVPRGKG